MREHFRKVAHWASDKAGTPWTFIAAVLVVLAWAIIGPVFNFSNTWQLFINSFTTIVTFLMVFLIQNTQNRDARAVHLKLDELIRASRPARDNLIDIEDMEDGEMELLQEEFKRFRDAKIVEIKRRRKR